MNGLLCIVSIFFGGLSLIAAISQMRGDKKSTPAVLMIIGSVMLISAVICNLAKQQFDFVLALIGCAAICIAAICNGLNRPISIIGISSFSNQQMFRFSETYFLNRFNSFYCIYWSLGKHTFTSQHFFKFWRNK